MSVKLSEFDETVARQSMRLVSGCGAVDIGSNASLMD
jgi:hypothetical protein